MALYCVAKQKSQIVCLEECTGVFAGFKTERFKFYQEKNYFLEEDRCFSIVFKWRSFDFVAKNKKIRDKIVNNINFLRECFEDENE